MKIDIIIGHSDTDESRDRNLRFIVKRYKKLIPQGQITIVEQNTESDLSDLNVSNHILRKALNHLIIVVDMDSMREQKKPMEITLYSQIMILCCMKTC